MKNLLRLSVLVITLIFASCDDSNDNDDKNPLIGFWLLESKSSEDRLSGCQKESYIKFTEYDFEMANYYIDFENDDDCKAKKREADYTREDEDTLIFTDKNESIDYSISEDKLTLVFKDDKGETTTSVYKK